MHPTGWGVIPINRSYKHDSQRRSRVPPTFWTQAALRRSTRGSHFWTNAPAVMATTLSSALSALSAVIEPVPAVASFGSQNTRYARKTNQQSNPGAGPELRAGGGYQIQGGEQGLERAQQRHDSCRHPMADRPVARAEVNALHEDPGHQMRPASPLPLRPVRAGGQGGHRP